MAGENFSPLGTCAILESPPSPPEGGGGTGFRDDMHKFFKFCEFCCRILIFFVSEERVPTQLKQASIVGTKSQPYPKLIVSVDKKANLVTQPLHPTIL